MEKFLRNEGLEEFTAASVQVLNITTDAMDWGNSPNLTSSFNVQVVHYTLVDEAPIPRPDSEVLSHGYRIQIRRCDMVTMLFTEHTIHYIMSFPNTDLKTSSVKEPNSLQRVYPTTKKMAFE